MWRPKKPPPPVTNASGASGAGGGTGMARTVFSLMADAFTHVSPFFPYCVAMRSVGQKSSVKSGTSSTAGGNVK